MLMGWWSRLWWGWGEFGTSLEDSATTSCVSLGQTLGVHLVSCGFGPLYPNCMGDICVSESISCPAPFTAEGGKADLWYLLGGPGCAHLLSCYSKPAPNLTQFLFLNLPPINPLSTMASELIEALPSLSVEQQYCPASQILCSSMGLKWWDG